MNTKVEEFIAKITAEEDKLADKQKKHILTVAGLYETEKIYSDTSNGFPYYDSDKKQYYKTEKRYYDVTDDEYAIIKEYVKKKTIIDQKANNVTDAEAEKTLSTIATIALYLGIITAIIAVLILLTESGIIAALSLLAFGTALIIIWATLKVFVNISLSLRSINRKLKE